MRIGADQAHANGYSTSIAGPALKQSPASRLNMLIRHIEKAEPPLEWPEWQRLGIRQDKPVFAKEPGRKRLTNAVSDNGLPYNAAPLQIIERWKLKAKRFG